MWIESARSNRIFWTGSWRFVGTDRPGLHRSLCCVGGCGRWGGRASSLEGHIRGLHSWVCSASTSPVATLTNLSVLIQCLQLDLLVTFRLSRLRSLRSMDPRSSIPSLCSKSSRRVYLSVSRMLQTLVVRGL